jgi:hypothetical protein
MLLRAGALLFVLPPVLFAPDAHAQAPSQQSAGYATAVMERASERYDRLGALCADFTQEMRVALLNQVTRSEGRICQQDPDLLSMRFTDPAGDQVVADGEYLWMYFSQHGARPGGAPAGRRSRMKGRTAWNARPGARRRAGRTADTAIGLVTLGCDKNTVDSERMMAALVGHGARVSTGGQSRARTW